MIEFCQNQIEPSESELLSFIAEITIPLQWNGRVSLNMSFTHSVCNNKLHHTREVKSITNLFKSIGLSFHWKLFQMKASENIL